MKDVISIQFLNVSLEVQKSWSFYKIMIIISSHLKKKKQEKYKMCVILCISFIKALNHDFL